MDVGRVSLQLAEHNDGRFRGVIRVDGTNGLIVQHADLVQRGGELGQPANEVLAALVDGHDAEMLI